MLMFSDVPLAEWYELLDSAVHLRITATGRRIDSSSMAGDKKFKVSPSEN